jgi:hypothetical protein
VIPSNPHRKVHGLLEYWRSVHRDGRLPGRRDFDPTAHAELLPNVSLVEVHRAPLRFRYRLLGSRADTVLGRRLTGAWLDQHLEFRNGDEVLKQYVAVVETAQPFWRRGVPLLLLAMNCATIEVLRLPLATDGALVDMVLSLSIYFDEAGRELDIDPLQRR